MTFLRENYLALIQLVLSALIIVLILLQERSAGLSGLMGGDSGFYQTRRGLEKVIFIATIVLAVIFTALTIGQLLHNPYGA